jgi:hypothetical protein
MKTISFEKMSQINGGKMFGVDTSCGACFEGSQICTTTYTIFWIEFSGGPNAMPCAVE